LKRLLSTVFLLGILAVGGTSGVLAAPPENNKNYDTIDLVCGEDEYTVVTIQGSQRVAFQSVDSGDVFIVVSFDVIDSSGDTVTIPVGQGKRTGQQGDLITCETPNLDTVSATFVRVP
jgi:hypothetical protein